MAALTSDNLPRGAIGLRTTEGEELLRGTSIVNDLMVERYIKQVNRSFCGPASLALMMNALNIGYRIKYMEIQGNETAEKEFYSKVESEEPILLNENDIVNLADVNKYVTSVEIGKKGLTLIQLRKVVEILTFGVNVYFACGFDVCKGESTQRKLKEEMSSGSQYNMFEDVNAFREVAKDLLKRPVSGLIVNYDMSMLGYDVKEGHFSPIAAYNEGTDRFLVMDVWPDYPPAWHTTDNLFGAMSSLDGDSGLPRGLLHMYELLF